MSKYKAGDKIVIEITGRFTNAYDHEYYSVLDSIYSTDFIDDKTEPLSTYTEPLDDKIRRQAAEITRLLRENNELKEQMKFGLPTLISEEDRRRMDISKARAEGQNEAWSMARKIFSMEIKDIEDIFIGTGAWNLGTVLDNNTYLEAATKVEAWEKAKEEIKVGDVVKCEGSYGVITEIGTSTFSGIRKDSTVFHWYKVNCIKTGRHIDIDSFLKQIGEEQE